MSASVRRTIVMAGLPFADTDDPAGADAAGVDDVENGGLENA
jgi:hypothetical protein